MTTNLNPVETNTLFHYQTGQIDDADVTPLLPRSGWISRVSYLRVLFRTKKRLDQIEENTKRQE